MEFNGTLTTIGSLPCISAEKSCEVLLKYTPELPAWPQLPKKSFKENMYVQYSENFPGITIDEENQKVYIITKDTYSQLEKFYEHFLSNDFEHFAISKDYAAGFHQLINSGVVFNGIKCQTTGPITFGLSIKDENGQSIFYDAQLRDVVIKHITMKSLWQLNRFSLLNPKPSDVVLFLDEPYLAAYGSAFTAISREDITNSLQEVVRSIKKSNNLRIGVHCCANTDWSNLLDTDIDILSFDAYEFFDNLVLYIDKLIAFVNRGGVLSWGIVPTNEEAIAKESNESLSARLKKYIKILKDKGVQEQKILKQCIITPACGLGSKSEETATKVLELLKDIKV